VTGILDYRPTAMGEFIAKYNTNGQFLRVSGMSNAITAGQQVLSNFNIISDYLGNVYMASGLGSATSFDFTYFDQFSTIGSNIQSLRVMSFSKNIPNAAGTANTSVLRKYNNDLQFQYLLHFSNAPYISTALFGISNICIDRTNALYIVGSALNSTIGTGVGITTPQTFIPVPQWQGMRGPPYGGATSYFQTSNIALSSPMVSTGTYSFIMRYK
jgi:hypothetical protein